MPKTTIPVRIAFFVLLLSLCACTITNPQKYFDAAQVKKPYDAVIVPGVPFNGTSWDSTMKLRVHWAVHLYKEGIARNIIFSGGAVYTPYVEAEIMSLYAQELGVPKEHCFIDPLAEHSTENIFYGWKKGRELGFTPHSLGHRCFPEQDDKVLRQEDAPQARCGSGHDPGVVGYTQGQPRPIDAHHRSHHSARGQLRFDP